MIINQLYNVSKTMLLIYIIPLIWIFAHIYISKYQLVKYINKKDTFFTKYVVSGFLHVSFFHLMMNIISWNYIDFGNKIFTQWIILLLFIGGTILGQIFVIFIDRPAIGASSGLLSIYTYYFLNYRYKLVIWNPIFFMSNNGIIVAGSTSIIIDIILDYIAENLRNNKNIHQLQDDHPNIHWFLTNINIIRYGAPDVSFWGHFGGIVFGTIIFIISSIN